MKYGLMKFNNNGTDGIWLVELYEIRDGQALFRTGTRGYKYGTRSFVVDYHEDTLRKVAISDAVFLECDVMSGKAIAEGKAAMRKQD